MTDKTVAQKARVKHGTTIAVLNRVPGVVESLGLPEDVTFVDPSDAQRDVVYVASVSVDGFLGADDGDNAWVVPDPELHRHFNALEDRFDTHLYGRRMYELMSEYWPVADEMPDAPDYVVEYARIWRAMPKVVFSKTLQHVDWSSRLFAGDAAEEVARLKSQPGVAMSVGGAALATTLAQRGLIDEFRFYVMPTVVGSGTPIFASLGSHLDLTTVEVQQFNSGAVLLRYRARSSAARATSRRVPKHDADRCERAGPTGPGA